MLLFKETFIRAAITMTGTLLLLGAVCGLVRAQSQSPGSLEIDLDTRARVAAVGKSGVKLNTSAIRAVTGLGPGLRFEVYGTSKYNAYAVQQAFVEKEAGVNRYQTGLVRLPFGIYDTQETYASGLINYPLPRGDYAYHSVDWGAPGIAFHGGTPQIQVEAAGFDGKSTGIWDNQNIVRGGAVRLQTYTHGVILGISRWDGGLQEDPADSHIQPVHMNGVDVRYTQPHLLLRGEFLMGELGGDHETGWYLDTYYHLPQLAKWTLTGRLEQFKPGTDYPSSRQVTLGVRYVASPQWTLVLNWVRNNAASSYQATWTTEADKNGDIFLQVFHKLNY